MNGVQTRFKCKLDVKRCKRFVFPPSSLLPRSNALKTKAIRYFQTDRTLTRIVSPPLITFENGKVIQEKKAAETLRQFIMTVGIKKVSALGIKQCNVPLVSNILDSKYGSDQKPIGNGWYLMSRNNTHSKKRDIERIAKALGIQVTVEIV